MGGLRNRSAAENSYLKRRFSFFILALLYLRLASVTRELAPAKAY
jgi:hypothetical protein